MRMPFANRTIEVVYIFRLGTSSAREKQKTFRSGQEHSLASEWREVALSRRVELSGRGAEQRQDVNHRNAYCFR